MIKRFKCTVERSDEYIIEMDDEQFDDKKMKKFEQNMRDFTTLQEHAAHIALLRAIYGTYYQERHGRKSTDRECSLEPAINLIIVREGECDVDVREIKGKFIRLAGRS